MASTYISKSSYETPTSTKIFTFSCWVKRGSLGVAQRIFDFYNSPFVYSNQISFNSSDQLGFGGMDDNNARIYTNRLFRDTNGWYHIVAVFDSTDSTASDRLKLYVNGERETSFSAQVNCTLNKDYQAFTADIGAIGSYYTKSSEFFNGSMSHIHFIDGTAYDASAFGQFDANGVWTIKTSPSVTYGNNGFFILKDGNSVTDQSGNGNNYTVGGGTLTNTEDNPSNVFATMNPLQQVRSGSAGVFNFSNGNTTIGKTSDSIWRTGLSTLGVTSGKYYCELKYGTETIYTGIASFEDYINESSGYPYVGDLANGVTYQLATGESSIAGVITSYGDSFSSGDILGIALDLDNNYIYFSRNGTWQNSGDPTSGATGTGGLTVQSGKTYMFGTSAYGNGNTYSHDYNFGNGYFGTTAVASAGTNASGNGIFEYDVPTGFTALSTKGLNT